VILVVSYTAYLIAATVMTLGVLEGHSLLQAFSSAIFHICGTSPGTFASAELLVVNVRLTVKYESLIILLRITWLSLVKFIQHTTYLLATLVTYRLSLAVG